MTQNLKDFPESTLSRYGLEAQHPDEFIANHLSLSPESVCGAVRDIRARLKNPPISVEEYLGHLEKVGLVTTAAALRKFQELL